RPEGRNAHRGATRRRRRSANSEVDRAARDSAASDRAPANHARTTRTSPVRIVDLIEHKREGGAHSRAELEALVQGYVRGAVPDYQVAAWLMAVCWRGMS